MAIRDLLKKNKITRKTGKDFYIIAQFVFDAMDYLKYYLESAINKGDYRYSIMLIVHSLEKGMCMPNPRPFGNTKVKELIKYLNKYGVEARDSFEYKLGISVLFAWRDYFFVHNWNDNEEFRFVEDFLENKECPTDISAGYKIYKPNSCDSEAFIELVTSRRSVRDYKSKTLEMDDIKYALQCFIATPTACNRQMCKIYWITSDDKKELLFDVIIGLSGFNTSNLNLFIITYDLSAFAYSGERQQGLLNSGLCAANFINALHAKSIGSCCLQWSNKSNQDRIIRKKLGLSSGERIALVIGAGYYLDESIIPCSVRKGFIDVFDII